MPPAATVAPAGLEGVVAAETRMSLVDGARGVLVIAGFPVEEIAPNANFEEVLHLLWNDRLPTKAELATLRKELSSRRSLPPAVVELLQAAAREKAPVIDALRMGCAALSLGQDSSVPRDDALRLVAAFPTIVATHWRLLHGERPVPPDPSLSHVANFLFMLTGKAPTAGQTRALETYLNTVSDHGFNASTFTARVIMSTQSDMISAVTGAIGALKGPLHGGAPGPALDMVFDIKEKANAERFLRAKLERGERLMGFGHRVYKVRDPRADVLAAAAKKLFAGDADRKLYDLATTVEATALKLLDEYKPGRNLKTNVEFYTALVLHGIGLPTDLFTPCFAVGRVAGWTAHCFEQTKVARLIRPQSVYVGPTDRKYMAIDRR